MNFPFKAIIFDWAYTLVDLVKEDDRAAFRKIIGFLKEKGVGCPNFETIFPTYQELFQNMIEISRETHREACFQHVLNYLLFQHEIALDGKTDMTELLTIYYKEIYAPRKLYPDVLPALKTLKADGIRMSILSNTTNPKFMKDFERNSLDLDPYFEFSIYSSEVPYRKPHPSIFKLALSRFQLEPGEILCVGDNPQADVAGAQGVGIAAAWLNRDKLERGHGVCPDYEIHSLADLQEITARKTRR